MSNKPLLHSQIVQPSTARRDHNPIYNLEHVPAFELEAKAALDRVVQATAVGQIPMSSGKGGHSLLAHQSLHCVR